MSDSAVERIFLGFDPGGKSGVALLRVRCDAPPLLDWSTVSSVNDAVHWFFKHLNGSVPVGIGIDTPLSWETGPCGWRGPDRWLRNRYPTAALSVVSTNSAYGAMVVQGVALALRMHERLGVAIALNETHPKVLHYALRREGYPRGALMPPDNDRVAVEPHWRIS